MIDLRRTQLQEILVQVKQFLETEPIPRQHAQVDPEKSFTTPAFGDAPEFDDFLDTKDKKGGKYVREISTALDKCRALLQAMDFYSDVRSEKRADLHRELLNRRVALTEEIERFESHGISLDEKEAFSTNAQNLQNFIETKGFGMDQPLPDAKPTSKKQQNLSGASEKIVQCGQCSSYVKIYGTPPATLPGQTGPELLVPLTYCPICGYPIGRGTSAERVRI